MLGIGLLGTVLAHIGLMQILGSALSSCMDAIEAFCAGMFGTLYSCWYMICGTITMCLNIPFTWVNSCIEFCVRVCPFI